MQTSPEQRQTISNNCLATSWQLLGPWRQRHHAPVSDAPGVVLDWLSNANHCSQALAEDMVRAMTQKLWRIEQRTANVAPDARNGTGAAAPHATQGVSALDVFCAGQRWTLWLQPRAHLHLLRISR